MKKFFFLPLIASIAFLAFTIADPLSKKERKFAVDHLQDTKKELIKTVSRLNAAQLSFKPAADRWSVEECVKHIAATEVGLRKWMDNTVKEPANPDKRSEIKATDEEFNNGFQDRSKKFQAADEMKPENTPYKTADEALQSFKDNRDNLIQYMKGTKDELRNHVAISQMGAMDAYQLVLLISAHSNRHTQQIKEVMADPNFPKK